MTRRIFSGSSASPQAPLPVPGDVVAEKYRIERTLGMGGMGAVFEVSHCVTHKRFAIKWLLAQTDSNADADVKRFIREAQIAGRIKHPNVVEVYDVYFESAGVFLVMELLEGESLATRLERAGRLQMAEALHILCGCLEGLSAAHAAGVVHRDIKPANIFLCRTSGEVHPKLVDFGVSRLVSRPGALEHATTRSGMVIGTPHYMAPEQMRGAAVDQHADVYALGVTLYEMLAGVRPYDAATYPELVLQIAAGQARPLRELAPLLPRELSALVGRAMAPAAEDRYPTVAALREAILPLMASTSAQPLAAQRARGTRWVWIAAAVLVLAVAGWLAMSPRLPEAQPELVVQPNVAPAEQRPAAAGSGPRDLAPAPLDSVQPAASSSSHPAAGADPQPSEAKPAHVDSHNARAHTPRSARPSAASSGASRGQEVHAQPARPHREQPEPPPASPPSTTRARPTVKLDRSGF